MSGIVGILNFDKSPLDHNLLARMTDAIKYRGPDRNSTWAKDHVGFGHTLLATTYEHWHEEQPYSLDDKIWIVADARVDDRQGLRDDLAKHDCYTESSVTDAELILWAYQVWGQDCVHHLIGDFAFVIWDQSEQKLFCARDHMGVKPFYYYMDHEKLIFANTLYNIFDYGNIDQSLNDLAILDFLAIGINIDSHTTAFQAIKRLPPAHFMIIQDGVRSIHQYWTPYDIPRIRYRRDDEYIEHFQEIFKEAVQDRLRTDSFGIYMSGGLDSSSVAAMARQVSKECSQPVNFQAYTAVFDRIIPDEERYYSGIVAEHLDIPINYLVADDYELFGYWKNPIFKLPEPLGNPLNNIFVDQVQSVAQNHRVMLSGEGGDPIFARSGLSEIWSNASVVETIAAMLKATIIYGLPPYFGVRSFIKKSLGKKDLSWRPTYPTWLNENLAQKYSIEERWNEYFTKSRDRDSDKVHLHERAGYLLTSSYWSSLFEADDPGVIGLPVEARHPLFDMRVINFVLGLFPIPWSVKKHLLRATAQNMLPPQIANRPKTTLVGEPVMIKLKQNSYVKDYLSSETLVEYYVNLDKWQNIKYAKCELG